MSGRRRAGIRIARITPGLRHLSLADGRASPGRRRPLFADTRRHQRVLRVSRADPNIRRSVYAFCPRVNYSDACPAGLHRPRRRARTSRERPPRTRRGRGHVCWVRGEQPEARIRPEDRERVCERSQLLVDPERRPEVGIANPSCPTFDCGHLNGRSEHPDWGRLVDHSHGLSPGAMISRPASIWRAPPPARPDTHASRRAKIALMVVAHDETTTTRTVHR